MFFSCTFPTLISFHGTQNVTCVAIIRWHICRFCPNSRISRMMAYFVVLACLCWYFFKVRHGVLRAVILFSCVCWLVSRCVDCCNVINRIFCSFAWLLIRFRQSFWMCCSLVMLSICSCCYGRCHFSWC